MTRDTEPHLPAGAADDLLSDKDEGARIKIAQRVGELLSLADLPQVARQAAESLARQLMNDALERVREALSFAVRQAKNLPRDIALKIAHDVDAVACPFLEVTEVFSDADWQQIVLTVSRAALATIANRSMLSEEVALAIVSTCETDVAEVLVENPASPMTGRVCNVLLERFGSATWIVDSLAERDDLFGDIAVRLATMVSAAAREKLIRVYRLADFTEPVVIDAEDAALLQIIRNTSEPRLPRLVTALRQADKLSHTFVLLALRENLMDFVIAATSDLAGTPRDDLLSLAARNGSTNVVDLLRKAGFSEPLISDLRKALSGPRSR